MQARGKNKSSGTAKEDAVANVSSGSVTTASVNLTKNLIGAGIFSLPAAMKKGSIIPGVSAMLIVGFFCGSTFVLIAFLCGKLGAKTYRDIWCVGFGKRSAVLVDFCIFANGFFACVSYVILIADFLQKALEGLLGWTGVSRVLIVWLNTMALLLPLSHARDLSPLRYTSMMGLGIIGLVFLYVVLDFLGSLEVARANLHAHSFHLDFGIFSTIALCTGAFKAHYNAPKFFKELNNDLGAHTTMVCISFGSAFLLYASFAVAGLGLFGDEILGNVLRNYGAEGNTAILMAWMGMAFAITFTYPLVFTSARDSLIGMVPALQLAGRRSPGAAHVIITSSLVATISSMGCMVDDVSLVTGLLGASIGSMLCWIFPACIYLKIVMMGPAAAEPLAELDVPLLRAGRDSESSSHQSTLPFNGALAAYSALVIVIGTASMILGIFNVFGLV